YGAEEAFLTGTFGAQTPVESIDGRTIGTSGQWPVIEKLRQLYKDLVRIDTA
ncbi:MAG: aminotransferase class IV, partial [Proteobacteria bacterium]|nr:aminotransferase class IV [Pseudomonadota bacterium]